MPRQEMPLVEGWRFALGTREDAAFAPVRMPHDWAIDAPIRREMPEGYAQGFRDRWGVGWYRRALPLPEIKAGHRYFLDFGGVYERSTVWVNGNEAGGQGYGYTPFRLDITRHLQAGDNRIEVKVDNTAHPADRWYSGCGIYRPVKLVVAEESHLDARNVVVRCRFDGQDALVSVETGVQGDVRAVLAGEGAACEARGNGALTLQVPNARRWSAEEPNLYTLSLSLLDGAREADRIEMRIGLREIAFDAARGMLVNDRPVKLRGVCLHQDVGCRGTAAKPEIWRERLAQLKEMGCNAIRPSHHMFADDFLDLCDEMGFYVYEEAFDKWTGGLYGRYFDTSWQEDLGAMVRRDRNRACVCIWGVGNEVENQGQPGMLAILEKLVAHVKSLDATRPVSCAMNPHFKKKMLADMAAVKDIQAFVDEVDEAEITDEVERLERIAAIAARVDIIACNYQEQWYEAIHAKCPDKLILGTEVYQYFSGHPAQMKNMTETMPSLVPQRYDYVIGSMLWTGIDYLGESVVWPAKGWSGAPIRTNRERKPAFYVFQSQWTAEPMVHISMMDYSLLDEGVKAHWDVPMLADHWHFPQLRAAVVPYVIATNCDEVRLWCNGERLYLPGPSECANGLITGFLPWQPGEVRVEGCNGGVCVCNHVLKTPGPAVQLRFDAETVYAPAQPGYELLLTVRAVDEDGTPCFRESAMVRFCVEGAAERLAVDNGSLMHGEPYRADCMHMYHGAVSVQIALAGAPGRVRVTAYADGLREGSAVVAI